jgi:iron complex outermembrane receptor protein
MMKASLLRGAAVAWCLMAAPALAQDEDVQGEEGLNSNVIVVTAQKREQNILEVPVAVTALSEEVMDAAQVNDFGDLTAVSPSLTITSGGSKAGNTVALRGVGTFSFSTSVEPSVLVVLDDVALLQAGQAFGNLMDPARIEVLRGPQGTLFGKSASAGVVNIVTKDPTDYFTGYGQFSITDDEEYRLEGVVSGPTNDNGGFRVSGYYTNFDGFINNLTTGSTLGGEEGWGVRGKFVQEVGVVDLTFIADYSESVDSAYPDTYLRLDQTDGAGGPANEGYDLTGITPGIGNVDIRNNDDRYGETEQLLTALKADVDLGFATLSSITSFQDWYYYTENDQDGTADPTIFQFGPYNAQQFAQELRLTSPTTGAFDYLVGLYYSDGRTDRSFARTTTIPPLRQNWDSAATTESYAAFAQVGYDITPDTLVTVGARFNHEKIGVFFEDNRTATPVVYEGSDSESALTGKLSLQQFFGDGMMAFASVATGYKGQAYDISSGFDQRRAENPIKSEDSINYEIGVKGQALNGLAQFQLVGFWTDYDDFQAQGVNAALLVPQFELTNVGKLRTRGVEFDGSVSPVEGLTIFGSAAYVDATIIEFPDSQCYFGQTEAEGCLLDPSTGQFVQDLAGEDLANSPKFKFNVGLSFEQPVSEDVEFFARGNYTWQDKVNFSLSQNPRTIQDAYGIANAAIGIQGEDEDWALSLFVNNLFDKAYAARIIDDTTVRSDPYILLQQVPRDYSRHIGARVRFGF